MRPTVRPAPFTLALLAAGALVTLPGCAPQAPPPTGPTPGATDAGAAMGGTAQPATGRSRVGLRAGLFDAEQAIWNMRLLANVTPPRDFVGSVNSDLAFKDHYVIQGNYYGFLIWDISSPARPSLVRAYVCPSSQNDVSVYRNLLFVSAEAFEGRLDCGTQGVSQTVSRQRIRGIRIFDISDIRNPRYVGNVQTCRGSHTHSLLVDPDDPDHVYIYVSGSAPVRPAEELPGCSAAPPSVDPSSALFRIEVIRVPLAAPERAEIVSSPRIFTGLVAPPQHGMAPEERAQMEQLRARGLFAIEYMGIPLSVPQNVAAALLDSIAAARGHTGPPTAADSATLAEILPDLIMGVQHGLQPGEPRPGPDQCHDITLYPEIGLGGGACEGYGILLDISNPTNPVRLAAVADSNFAYWHSATFNNDGTAVLFTDEWGGGGSAKCRPTDPPEWGGNAIYSIRNGELAFRSYYKLPEPQSNRENCVAHNGSLIPIPGRDVMVQAWYQGGVSVFDWTDPENPFEIAYFDRGPVNENQLRMGGSWSAYWYNGVIVSSEIARGLDILELTPSEFLTQNEIDAAKTVRFDEFNPQGQRRFVWPATFVLARAYTDQLERSGALPAARIAAIRQALAAAEQASDVDRQTALANLAGQLEAEAAGSGDPAKVRLLASTIRELGG